MIKNIILDMGNVLLYFRPQESLDAFVEQEEDKKIIFKELFQGPDWIRGDKGEITNEERYEPVSKRVPQRLHIALKNVVEHWDMCMKPVLGAKEFCDYVKKKGYGLYILSNACSRFYQYFPPVFAIEDFDGVVVSSDVKMVKPNAEIYHYICEKYHLNPEECLFLDDRKENVEGAVNIGMQGEVFWENFEEIKEKYKL